MSNNKLSNKSSIVSELVCAKQALVRAVIDCELDDNADAIEDFTSSIKQTIGDLEVSITMLEGGLV